LMVGEQLLGRRLDFAGTERLLGWPPARRHLSATQPQTAGWCGCRHDLSR
jgi:hypothetical protein